MNEGPLKWVMEIPKRASRRWETIEVNAWKKLRCHGNLCFAEVDEWRNLLACDSLSHDPSEDVARSAKHLVRASSLKSERNPSGRYRLKQQQQQSSNNITEDEDWGGDLNDPNHTHTAKPSGSIGGVRMRIKFRKSIIAEVKSVEEWEDSIGFTKKEKNEVEEWTDNNNCKQQHLYMWRRNYGGGGMN